MIETLEQFKNRVYEFEYNSVFPDELGRFKTNDSLNRKVAADGSILPYIGNTIVFILNEDSKQTELLKKRILWIQEMLYTGCNKMLAEQLSANTLHMTLHDLKNGLPGQLSMEEIQAVGRRAKKELEELKRESWTIKLQTTCVFNMVNTSVVLGLEPCTDDDCRRLMELYEKLECIVPLGYPMTPHITLAYYKPGIYCSDDRKKLEYAFHGLSEEKITAEFTSEDLLYQEFQDMNHYL